MFRRRSPEQLLAMDLGDRFARTFFLSFFLTYVSYPFVLTAVSATGGSRGSGGIVIAAWLFGLPFAVKAFFVGMLVSGVIFFPTYRGLKNLMSNRFAASIAASTAIFFAVTCSVHTTFSFSPIAVTWDVGPHGYEFSNSLGVFASVVAALTARLMWIGADPDV